MTKDRLKEEISLYKLLMTLAFAVFSSMVGWLWNNYQFLTLKSATIVYLTIILSVLFILFLFAKTNFKIKELDNYD